MSKNNQAFSKGLLGALDDVDEESPPTERKSSGILASRENRMAELASGAVVGRALEQVDPARCRMWSEHNRDYDRLDEVRCADLIESMKAQGRQEFPAIVRRVRDVEGIDFEVICGARRHWTVSWLRTHNYPEFRFLIEIRNLTDEEAFRLSDLENRAREDISDIERAREYLKALGKYYGGKQKEMAARMDASEAWLSRYLDLARAPDAIISAFLDPHRLKISNVQQIKALMKPETRLQRVLAEAKVIANEPIAERPVEPKDVIRRLTLAADSKLKSKASAAAGKAGAETITSPTGTPLFLVEPKGKKDVQLTLKTKGGGTRAEAEAAFADILQRYWPQ